MRNSLLPVLMLAVQAGPACAFTHEFGDDAGQISFDTTVSAGVLVRAQDRDPRLIGIVNGGSSRTVNEDNGNLNYEKGEVVSELLKATHELDIAYGKSGLFARFGYFTDLALRRKDFGQTVQGDDLGTIAHKRLDFDAQLFDAYVRHEFALGERKLNVRLGNQVVSWGESTFIQGGINVINPVDLTRLRSPGAELKEAFIPVPVLLMSSPITETITLELFNQFRFEPFQIDPSGTFFSTTDVFGPGGSQSFTGFGRTPDNAHGEAAATNSTVPRGADRFARNNGQFGGSLRIFLADLNSTELGLYALNYHSRIPMASTTMAGCLDATPVCAPSRREAASASIFTDYQEDIQLYGLSFNTPGPFGVALQGEYSFRPNLPVQVSPVELLLATLGLPNQAGYGSDIPNDPSGAAQTPGTKLDGYRRVPYHQMQFTALKALPNVLGAEQLILLTEAAYVYMDLPQGIKFGGPATSLPSEQHKTVLEYPTPLLANGSVQPGDQGYATKSSYGYRLVGRLEYADVFAGVNLFPRLVFSHDVKGVSQFLTEGVKSLSAGLNATYNQSWSADIAYVSFFGGREFKGTDCETGVLTSTSLTALDLSAFASAAGTSGALCQAPSGPTSNFNQAWSYAGIANPNIDRDFVSASLSYSF